MRHRDMWKICKYFTHLNTFVYRDKRIYIELDDKQKVYSVKVVPSNIFCMRVPLRSWTRIQTARMSSKIIDNALQIREKHEINKHNEEQQNEHDRDQLINRIVEIENTLKTMNATLNAISKKLMISIAKQTRKTKRRRKNKLRKSIDESN